MTIGTISVESDLHNRSGDHTDNSTMYVVGIAGGSHSFSRLSASFTGPAHPTTRECGEMPTVNQKGNPNNSCTTARSAVAFSPSYT